ncbi:glycoside hydrolase family 2 protein [Candidatus Kryptobacter tengchongensis]|uniref:Uncharacterized protein n=1 Tax=Kryptobacter tengchongensis TaxID=1643429 RepID=A0A656DAS5_KRYT1|nr:glycoside hydrolase family 2 protein [Candidatus Kryptobacter tengchongensis]CUT04953.1 hypothetical protein JGI24_01596 [Candidatus Kryptobacter tengchongensis]
MISWSAIDYRKRPKALYYYAKKFFHPVIIVVKKSDDKVKIFGVNDYPTPIDGNLIITTFTTHGLKKFEKKIPATLEKNSVAIIFEGKLENLEISKPETDYIRVKFESNGKIISENSLFLTEPKFLNLQKFGIAYRFLKAGEDEYILKMSSKNLIKSVFIYFEGLDAKLSDNFFDLHPDEPVEIKINSNATLQQLLNSIRMKMLT